MFYEVYKVKEWHYCEGRNGRAEFTGEVAEPEIQKLFKLKKIPEKYRKKDRLIHFYIAKWMNSKLYISENFSKYNLK